MLRTICLLPRIPAFSALALAALASAGCVANDAPSGNAAEPRTVNLSFECGDGESLTLTGDGASLLVRDSQDASVRVEASPPGQTSRYDADGHALVINNGEALWMKAGAAPMTCRR